tara:strand:+ start:346 stop:624 length:279 start_codon:yes stop_codon:yes gene_type:complete
MIIEYVVDAIEGTGKSFLWMVVWLFLIAIPTWTIGVKEDHRNAGSRTAMALAVALGGPLVWLISIVVLLVLIGSNTAPKVVDKEEDSDYRDY